MKSVAADDKLRIVSRANLSPAHVHTLNLLYLPVVGRDAFSLYMTLHSLIDRSKLQSPTYPHSFLYDLLDMNPGAFFSARQTLEASALIETYKGEEDYLIELFPPLSAESFIKDAPFGAYLKQRIGEERFNDLIAHFRIVRPKKGDYRNCSVRFDEVFPPVAAPVKSRASFMAAEAKKTEILHATDIDLVLESLPPSLVSDKTKTKRCKEKLKEIAYIYNLNEETLRKLLRQSLLEDGTIDFAELSRLAQKSYAGEKRVRIRKKSDTYNLEYFKSVHPKTLLEEATGMRAPAADARVIERLVTETDLSLEVINVLIAYVLKELDQRFPTYNYFEKIVGEWKRTDIASAEDAVAHIEKKVRNRKEKSRSQRKGGRVRDAGVDWLDDYLDDKEK